MDAERGTINANACSLTITGTTSQPGYTNFTAGTSTVSFVNPSNFQAIPSISYYNLTLSGAGQKYLQGGSITGTMSLESGVSQVYGNSLYFSGSGSNLRYNTGTTRYTGAEWPGSVNTTGGVTIVSGTVMLNNYMFLNNSSLTINSGATLNTENNQMVFGGNFINNGTFIGGSSPINIYSVSNQSISGFTTTGLIVCR